MDKTLPKLKSCPFCGSPGECLEGTSKYGFKTFYVGCSDEENCSTSMLFCYAQNSPEWAIKDWNTRALDKKLEKLIFFLKQLVSHENSFMATDLLKFDNDFSKTYAYFIIHAKELLEEINTDL